MTYEVIINGRQGATGLDHETAIAEAYEHIARKYRDADTEHCIAELEKSGRTSYDTMSVAIREEAA